MKKSLSILFFLSVSLLSFGQWTQFSTGNLRNISCGSDTELIGIAGTATNNAIYKYDFANQSWYILDYPANTYYNSISIAADGNAWGTGITNGGEFIRKWIPGFAPLTQASSVINIDVQSNSSAVGILGAGLNTMQANTGTGVAFTALPTFPYPAYKVSIGDDGTVYGLANPVSYSSNVFRLEGTTWVNIPGRLYDISVGSVDKVVGLDGNGIRYYLKEDQWVADIGAPYNCQKITVSGDGNVYVITNETTANIYHNTWAEFSCKPAQATDLSSAGAKSICTGTSTLLTVSSQADIVEWYEGGTLIATGLSYQTPVLTSTTTYEVRTTSNGCSNTKNITVTVNQVPSLTLTTPAANLTVCSGSSTTLTASGPNLFWYDDLNAPYYVGWNGSFTTGALDHDTTFWVQAGNGECKTVKTQIDISILPIPSTPINISNLGTVCPGSVTVTVQSDYDIEWFATNTSTTVLGTGLTYTIPNAVNGSIVFARAINGSCISPRLGIGISAYPGNSNYSNPVSATPAENLIVCVGGTTKLIASGIGEMHWTDAFGGGNLLGTGDTLITPAITGATNIFYHAVNGNCNSNYQYMRILTNDITNTTPTSNLSICEGMNATLTATTTLNSPSWYSSATSETPVFTGNTFTTGALQHDTTLFLSYNSPSCMANRIAVNITVQENPAAPTISSPASNQQICVGSGTQISMNSVGTVSWFGSQTGGISFSNSNPLNIGIISAAQDLNYYAETQVGNCVSERTFVQTIVNEIPNAPTNISNLESLNICSGNSTTLEVSSSGTVVWFDAEIGGNQIGSGLTFQTGNLSANQTFYAESQAGSCTSSSRMAVTVNVTPIPSEPNNTSMTTNLNICAGNTTPLSVSSSNSVRWFDSEISTTELANTLDFVTPIVTSSSSFWVESVFNNCASTRIEIPVFVNPVFQVNLTETACDSFELNGQVYHTSGVYTQNLTTINTCDSIVTLDLTILNSTSHSLTETACDSYTLNGQSYTTSGVYTQILSNAAGCDSTITLNLTINHPSSAIISETACLSYTLNGQTYTTDGTYIQNLTTVNGCDSTLTLNLTISTFSTATLNETACTSFTLNNEVYTTSGVYTQTLTSAQGCDSIITLNLTINQPNSSILFETACDTYSLNGETFTQSGIFTQHISTVNGCDSTITLNLTIKNSSAHTLTEVACSSYDLNGTIYTNSGTYIQVIPNVNACDSTITLNLTINQPSTSVLTEAACGTFTLNGETFTQSGTYIQVIPNHLACDSTITLNLTITPNSSSSFNEIACDSYTWNAETYTQSGIYTQVFPNYLGCDSIVSLDLTINNSSTVTLTESACTSYELNGTIYTSSGTYTQNITSVSGCDSLITLNLTINQPSSSVLTETACGSFALNGETFTQSGSYTQILTNAQACDSIITLNLTINNLSSNNLSETACDSFELNGEVYTLSGTYTQILANSTGCDSTITLNLTINSIDASVTQEDSVLTVAQVGATYQWIDCTTNLPISGETSQTFVPEQNGEYAVELTLNSCTKTSDCFTFNNLNALSINQVNEVLIYPNPASSDFQIQTNEVGYELIVKDIAGKIVIKTNLLTQLTKVDVSILESGVYHVSLLKEGEMKFNSKLVVKH